MISWLQWLGLGAPCRRCGARVTHQAELFRIDDHQYCAECHAALVEIADRRRREESALGRLRYGGVGNPPGRPRVGVHEAETPLLEDRRSRD